MEDGPHAVHATPHARAVGDRADVGREGGREDIEADDLVLQVPQGADQGFAKVTGASRNQDFHARLLRLSDPPGSRRPDQPRAASNDSLS